MPLCERGPPTVWDYCDILGEGMGHIRQILIRVLKASRTIAGAIQVRSLDRQR